MKRFKPYVAKNYRCKCAERPKVNLPGKRLRIGRAGPDQWHLHDVDNDFKMLEGINDWPKCLGEEIIERFRSGELKRKSFSIIDGKIQNILTLPKHT